MSRQFHVADLVTAVSGHLLSPRHMDAVYDVVDFVTGQSHMTHQLPRAMRDTVAPELVRQHPWLADVPIPDVSTMPEVERWALSAALKYGEMHVVEALPEGSYVGREPIAELHEMAPHMPIIAVGEPPRDLDGGPR